MSVRGDGESLAREVCGRAQNCMNSEGRERKINVV
jgi:hypothetical protein